MRCKAASNSKIGRRIALKTHSGPLTPTSIEPDMQEVAAQDQVLRKAEVRRKENRRQSKTEEI